jgi:palmitoyltransferase
MWWVMVCLLWSQFGLPKAEKEQYEREQSSEVQQELLKKVALEMPVYTRTAGGGKTYQWT